jgi:hypothetical protein
MTSVTYPLAMLPCGRVRLRTYFLRTDMNLSKGHRNIGPRIVISQRNRK